ncbi:MAG: Riboflavin synthase [Firmicutes bacterium]|nr:Riboflavin synthase [Bacillota bacterium]
MRSKKLRPRCFPNLGQLRAGERINLERALALGGRLGGHIVQGHVDDVGKVAAIKREANAVVMCIQAEREIMAGIVPKGSIAVDGISLTVASLYEDSFEISLIPHTYAATTLCDRKIGDVVNLEVDIIGKYVARLISLDASKKHQVMTEAFLHNCGY